MYDMVIIGAGPAGATLARLLKKKKILLIDRRSLDRPYHEGMIEKSCGGLLAPDAQNMLGKLGLGVPKDILTEPQLFTVRNIDLTNKIEKYYQRNYLNMDREKFDRWLVGMLPDSVDTSFSTLFIGCWKIGKEYVVRYKKDNQCFEIKTKYVIGADGAYSKVRNIFYPDYPKPKVYIAIQDQYTSKDIYPYFSVFFDEEITDFYSWMIPKGEKILIGSALPIESNVHKKFSKLLKKIQDYGYDLSQNSGRRGIHINRTTALNQIYLGKDGVMLLGEAAGFISPSSAEGFSYAFSSAYALAQSFTDPDPVQKYEKAVRHLKKNIYWKNIKALGMYRPRLRKLAMKSNLLTMKPMKQGD